MALHHGSIEINGVTVHVTRHGYFRNQRLLMRLVKMMGPGVLGVIVAAGGGKGRTALAALMEMDLSSLRPMFEALFSQLEPSEMETLTKEILATAEVEHGGKRTLLVPVIDAVFSGEFWGVMVLQAFALKVHFGNFSGARDAFGKLGLTPSPSEESTT